MIDDRRQQPEREMLNGNGEFLFDLIEIKYKINITF